MTTLPIDSYLGGRWQAGDERGAELHNPTTEDVLATASSHGIDIAGALAFARNQGGPALRAMSFAERADLVGAMAKVLHAQREELLDLATQNGGNTRSDAKFDIDGATGTLSYYAKLGSELGARGLLADGEAIALGRSPRYVGRHFFAPRTGVAVLINAYNFPAWGFAEKAAAAILAGMPVLNKPATPTALVAWRMAQILVEAKILPAGAFSFLCGEPGDLLDQLDWQDVVAFTGSSRTGLLIRGNANVLAQGVRVNIEADSLNAAVLGPDIGRDDDTYDLFLREVVRDMTQKAGQKCTAIRRIFVTPTQSQWVREDLRDQLAAIKVGDPRQKGVHVGPLATTGHLEALRTELAALQRETTPLFGNGGRGELVGVEGDKGYFLAPTLLFAEDGGPAVHGREAFGPIATLMLYDGTSDQAAALLGRGRGSLVSSIYSDDGGFSAQLATAAAPYLGRIHLGSNKIVEHSPGPGTALPMMLHGGPGRAGGGAELGGQRALELYMQRTAIQGYAPLLDKLDGPS